MIIGLPYLFQVNSQLISNVATDALSAEKVSDPINLFLHHYLVHFLNCLGYSLKKIRGSLDIELISKDNEELQ